MTNLPQKVFVLALDGATFDLVRPWAEAGKLPLFKKLMDTGAWSEIESTTPPITPVAWLTFMTGKNPGKHGVFDFFQPIKKDYRELNPASAVTNREPTLWRILSQRGRKVCVLNVPMTYPPEAVNGCIFSGVPVPAHKHNYAYPMAFEQELKEHGWDLSRDAAFVQGSYEEFYAYLQELVEVRTSATLHLLRKETWDFFMVHYLETDQVLHTYWRFMESNDPSVAPSLREANLHFYQFVETQMTRIIEQLDEQTSLIIVSDHGMGPIHYHLHLNNWLLAEGFMQWRREIPTTLRRLLYKLGLNPSTIYKRIPDKLLKKFSFGQVRTELAQISREGVSKDEKNGEGFQNLRRRLVAPFLRMPFLDFGDIDWARTAAYSTGTIQTGFIHINLTGREPQGGVSLTEYNRVRNTIKERLSTWINPITGQKMVKQVFFKEELYKGHQLDHAPDIIVTYNEADYEAKKGSIFLSPRIVEPIKDANASHRPNGMLILSGVFFKPGLSQHKPKLIDMASLILYLMDEPIPTDFEGDFLESLIEPAMLAKRPLKWIEPEIDETHPSNNFELSAEEEATILEQLRGLGYLE